MNTKINPSRQFFICLLLLLGNTIAFAQENRDDTGRIHISDFLKDPFQKKKTFPNIYLETVHGMKKDFSLTGTSLTRRKLNTTMCNLMLSRYLLNKRTVFEIGKGKLGSDSVVYFSLASKNRYYIGKYASSLTFLGYFKSKTTIDGVCIRLINRYKDDALFTLFFDKTSNSRITQYDYVAGYNYTE